MSFDNTNTFTLNRNDKGDNPKRPDYTGKININGKEHWISAWLKDGPKGKWMSGTIGDECEPKGQPQQAAQQPTQDSFDDRDIPF